MRVAGGSLESHWRVTGGVLGGSLAIQRWRDSTLMRPEDEQAASVRSVTRGRMAGVSCGGL